MEDINFWTLFNTSSSISYMLYESITFLYYLQIFEECLQDRTIAELKLNELLDDCTQLQEKLFEIEGETYCELNVK